jgi:cholesterol oxidase
MTTGSRRPTASSGGTTERFDVVVIGSGFGGAVVACRLAMAGRSVCVVERGKRWEAADFPRSAGQVAEGFWQEGRSYGFLEYLAFRRIDVIQGAGVGGGSLHYFNVNLPASERIFRHPTWPGSITRDALDPFYASATTMLESAPLVPPPERRGELPARTVAFLAAARRAGHEPDLVPIAVHTGAERERPDGRRDRPCTYCGNCLFGCDIGAKKTLDRNYLAVAERHGAEVRPLHVAGAIRPRAAGGYQVDVRVLDATPGAPSTPTTLQCEQVVVAAGSLGSTRLLLRCRDELGTLPALGRALGSRFSLNGELLFAHTKRTTARVDPGLGPPITARVTATSGDLTATIQDLGVPDALLWYLEGAVPMPFARMKALARALVDYLRRANGGGAGGSLAVRLDALVAEPRTARTLPYLGMGTDSSDGEMSLRRGELAIRWRSRPNRELYRLMDDTLRALSAGAGGRYVPSILARWPLRRILTAHPLGGCPMGDDPATSVVDDRGQAHAYPGLFVVDGSMIPAALAVNPSLTIAALAERAAAAMVTRARAGAELVPLDR